MLTYAETKQPLLIVSSMDGFFFVEGDVGDWEGGGCHALGGGGGGGGPPAPK